MYVCSCAKNNCEKNRFQFSFKGHKLSKIVWINVFFDGGFLFLWFFTCSSISIANNQDDFIFPFVVAVVVVVMWWWSVIVFSLCHVLGWFLLLLLLLEYVWVLNYYNAFFSFLLLWLLLRCCHSGTRHCCCVLIVLEFKTQCCSVSSKYSHNYFEQLFDKLVNWSFKECLQSCTVCDCHIEHLN